MEFAQKVNPLSSSNIQIGSFRSLPSQPGGYAAQDAKFEERQPYEPRTLSIRLSKSVGKDAVTLGPQGRLGRGLSFRGLSSVSASSLSDLSSSAVESQRNPVGLNGFSSIDMVKSYSSREDSKTRSAANRYTGSAISDQSNEQGGIDVRIECYSSTRPASRGNGPALSQSTSLQIVWPDEGLSDMSIAAIREYYSAKDEKEVALCIKDLNSPSFYPSMVLLWVTDSFERKDMERDLLTKLLINFSRPEGGLLSQGQLIQGFESVLATREDAVTDAPKAAEFLGGIFSKAVVENVVPLSEVGQKLYEGGEEKGQLLEAGLAADVLGSTLETIQYDEGEASPEQGLEKLQPAVGRIPSPWPPMISMMLREIHLNPRR